MPRTAEGREGPNQADKLDLPLLSLPGLFFLVTLVLIHLSLARAKPVSGPARCLNRSQNLLKTTDNALKTVSFSRPSGFEAALLK